MNALVARTRRAKSLQDILSYSAVSISSSFSGHRHLENRWVHVARLMSWELVKQIEHESLGEDSGASWPVCRQRRFHSLFW